MCFNKALILIKLLFDSYIKENAKYIYSYYYGENNSE